MLDAATRAADELIGDGHPTECTCTGCMLDAELRRFRLPCARCAVPRWKHYKPHVFAEGDQGQRVG